MSAPSRPGFVRRAYHWLAVLPAGVVVLGVAFGNRVRPYVMGFPFLIAWVVGLVILTSAIMGLIYFLDQRVDRARSRLIERDQ
jgi:4-hydroxybenzoate polyprenyltransferase